MQYHVSASDTLSEFGFFATLRSQVHCRGRQRQDVWAFRQLRRWCLGGGRLDKDAAVGVVTMVMMPRTVKSGSALGRSGRGVAHVQAARGRSGPCPADRAGRVIAHFGHAPRRAWPAACSGQSDARRWPTRVVAGPKYPSWAPPRRS